MAGSSGPAFPSVRRRSVEDGHAFEGMSLRDYFAAQALDGAVQVFFTMGESWDNYNDFAQSVWKVADAMLEERGRAK